MGETDPTPKLGAVERWVVIGLLAGFVGFVVVLIFLRDNPNWDRLIYVFAGYEALVFAGAGTLFGVEIKRQEADAAQSKAQNAEQKAEKAEQAAAAGRALRETIHSKLKTRGEENTRRLGRPGVDQPSESQADLMELADLAERLFRKEEPPN